MKKNLLILGLLFIVGLTTLVSADYEDYFKGHNFNLEQHHTFFVEEEGGVGNFRLDTHFKDLHNYHWELRIFNASNSEPICDGENCVFEPHEFYGANNLRLDTGGGNIDHQDVFEFNYTYELTMFDGYDFDINHTYYFSGESIPYPGVLTFKKQPLSEYLFFEDHFWANIYPDPRGYLFNIAESVAELRINGDLVATLGENYHEDDWLDYNGKSFYTRFGTNQNDYTLNLGDFSDDDVAVFDINVTHFDEHENSENFQFTITNVKLLEQTQDFREHYKYFFVNELGEQNICFDLRDYVSVVPDFNLTIKHYDNGSVVFEDLTRGDFEYLPNEQILDLRDGFCGGGSVGFRIVENLDYEFDYLIELKVFDEYGQLEEASFRMEYINDEGNIYQYEDFEPHYEYFISEELGEQNICFDLNEYFINLDDFYMEFINFSTTDVVVSGSRGDVLDNSAGQVFDLSDGFCGWGSVGFRIVENLDYEFDYLVNLTAYDNTSDEVNVEFRMQLIDDIIRINTCQDLIDLENYFNHGYHYIVLEDNISCSGYNITTLGQFDGVFDGQGYYISDLTIENSRGLFEGFGCSEPGTTYMFDVGFINLQTYQDTGESIGDTGAIIGNACHGHIERVAIKGGEMRAYDSAGTLVSVNSGYIADVYSSMNMNINISGDSFHGGLVGWNWGSVETSYYNGEMNFVHADCALGSTEGNPSGSVFYNLDKCINEGEENHSVGLDEVNMTFPEVQFFLESGFDFAEVWGVNSEDNDGFAFLLWEGYTSEVVFGCTDDDASNYDTSATIDDGSCIFQFEADLTINLLSSDSVALDVGNYTLFELEIICDGAQCNSPNLEIFSYFKEAGVYSFAEPDSALLVQGIFYNGEISNMFDDDLDTYAEAYNDPVYVFEYGSSLYLEEVELYFSRQSFGGTFSYFRLDYYDESLSDWVEFYFEENELVDELLVIPLDQVTSSIRLSFSSGPDSIFIRRFHPVGEGKVLIPEGVGDYLSINRSNPESVDLSSTLFYDAEITLEQEGEYTIFSEIIWRGDILGGTSAEVNISASTGDPSTIVQLTDLPDFTFYDDGNTSFRYINNLSDYFSNWYNYTVNVYDGDEVLQYSEDYLGVLDIIAYALVDLDEYVEFYSLNNYWASEDFTFEFVVRDTHGTEIKQNVSIQYLEEEIIYGCTDDRYDNYDPAAEEDDGTCAGWLPSYCTETISPCGGGCPITNFEDMFKDYDFDTDPDSIGYISGWDTSCVTDMRGMFENTTFNQDIGGWDTSNVEDMRRMFQRATSFNEDISGWDTGNVMSMSYMFYEATSFNQDLRTWNVTLISEKPLGFDDLSGFEGEEHLQPLWGTDGLEVFGCTDTEAVNFDDSATIDDGSCYYNPGCTDSEALNYDSEADFDDGSCDYWTESYCTETISPCGGGCPITDFTSMFAGYDFEGDHEGVGDITGWDTSCVTNMSNMFAESNFNQSIGGWNVGEVHNMSAMFRNTPFDQPLGSWNTSSVVDMSEMFSGSSFDQFINGWDTSNVVTMSEMFKNTPFNRNIMGWNVEQVMDLSGMFESAELSMSIYDAVLNSWASQSVQNDVVFDAGNSIYSESSLSSRDLLVDSFNWTITDGGLYVVLGLHSVNGWALDVGQISNISGINCPEGVTCNLYRNGDLVSNPDVGSLSIGEYIYVYNTTGNENYSASSTSKVLYVQSTNGHVEVLLNGDAANVYLTYGDEVVIDAYSDNDQPLTVYLAGENIMESLGESLVLGVGTYEVLGYVEEDSPYQERRVFRYITVSKAIPELSLASSLGESFFSDQEVVITGSGCPSGLTCSLYKAGSITGNPFTGTLSEGEHVFIYETLGDNNYEGGFVELIVTVTTRPSGGGGGGLPSFEREAEVVSEEEEEEEEPERTLVGLPLPSVDQLLIFSVLIIAGYLVITSSGKALSSPKTKRKSFKWR